MQTTMRIYGLREIERAMLELPRRVDRKLLNDGLLAGARLVRDEARARAPLLAEPNPRRRRGILKRAIRALRIRPDRYAATVLVRVRGLTGRQISRFKAKRGTAARDNPNDPFYWRFVEFGTSKMAARPFLRPAFESRKVSAVRAAVDVFRVRVQAEVAKLGAMQRLRNNIARFR